MRVPCVTCRRIFDASWVEGANYCPECVAKARAGADNPEPAGAPRFGDRLRDKMAPGLSTEELADLIDQDAEAALSEVHEAWAAEFADLQAKIGEAVERLRCSTFDDDVKDVVDAESLLAEIARIFGQTAPTAPVDVSAHERRESLADRLTDKTGHVSGVDK